KFTTNHGASDAILYGESSLHTRLWIVPNQDFQLSPGHTALDLRNVFRIYLVVSGNVDGSFYCSVVAGAARKQLYANARVSNFPRITQRVHRTLQVVLASARKNFAEALRAAQRIFFVRRE